MVGLTTGHVDVPATHIDYPATGLCDRWSARNMRALYGCADMHTPARSVRRFCLLRMGRRCLMSEAQVEATENGLTHPEHVILTPTRNPSAGQRARELLARANEVLASAPLPLPRSPLTRTRAARRPNEGMACPATGAEMAPSASEDAAEDVSESCTI